MHLIQVNGKLKPANEVDLSREKLESMKKHLEANKINQIKQKEEFQGLDSYVKSVLSNYDVKNNDY